MNEWLAAHDMPQITVVENVDRYGNRLTLEMECLRSHTLPSIAYGYKRCSPVSYTHLTLPTILRV